MIPLLIPLLTRFGITEAEKWAKRLEPVLLALALLAAVGSAYLWAKHRGEVEQKAKDAGWVTAFYRSDANFRVAIAAVDQQNVAIKGLAIDGQQRAREAAEARDAALKANASLIKTQATLGDVAKRHYSSAEPCATPAEVMGAKI